MAFEADHVDLNLVVLDPVFVSLLLHLSYLALKIDNLELLIAKFISKNGQRALFVVLLHTEVLFTRLCKLGLELSYFLLESFLIILQGDSLVLEFLFDANDVVFLASELSADLKNLALQLLFKLDDPLFSPLQISCL